MRKDWPVNRAHCMEIECDLATMLLISGYITPTHSRSSENVDF